jgi:hypothetical protein
VRFVGQSGAEAEIDLFSRVSVCPSQFIIPPIRYIHSSIIRSVDSGPITGHSSTETSSYKNQHIVSKYITTYDGKVVRLFQITQFGLLNSLFSCIT